MGLSARVLLYRRGALLLVREKGLMTDSHALCQPDTCKVTTRCQPMRFELRRCEYEKGNSPFDSSF
jgi:hypothetical protein